MRRADDIGRFTDEDGNLLAYFDRKKNTLWISGPKESAPCQTDEEAWDKISLFEKTQLRCLFCKSEMGNFVGYKCMTFFSLKEGEEDVTWHRSEECILIENDLKQ